MDDLIAILVIICVFGAAGKVLKGVGGWFGSSDYNRDK